MACIPPRRMGRVIPCASSFAPIRCSTFVLIVDRNFPSNRGDRETVDKMITPWKRGPISHGDGMKFLIFGLILALAPVSAAAEPLFQSYDQGSREEVVLQKFPGAKLDEPNSKDGVRAHRLEDYPSDGMWTYFDFVDGGLAEVKLHGRGAAKYLEIVEGLKAKYGKPTSESFAADSGLAIWRRGTTSITARLEPSYRIIVGTITEPFTVTYEPTSRSVVDAL